MNSETKLPRDEGEILMDFLPKLIRLVEVNVSNRLRAKIGHAEVEHSIMASIIRMERQGKIKIEESEDFWKQLVVVSLNKVRKKARYFSAKKRDYRREIQLGEESTPLAELTQDHREPTDEEGVAFEKLLERLQETLDDSCRIVLEGKLEGLTHLEIAAKLPSKAHSAKTVSRRLTDIREAIAKLSGEDD